MDILTTNIIIYIFKVEYLEGIIISTKS